MSDALTPAGDAGEKLWAIHVHGPDDIIAMASEEAARKEALALTLAGRSEDPPYWAEVIEWPFSPEEHKPEAPAAEVAAGDSRQMMILSNRLAGAVRDLRVYFEELADAIGPASTDDDVRELWVKRRAVEGMIRQLLQVKAAIQEETDKALLPWMDHHRERLEEGGVRVGDVLIRPGVKKRMVPQDAKPEAALYEILADTRWLTPGEARQIAQHLAIFLGKNAVSHSQFEKRVSTAADTAPQIWRREIEYVTDETGAKKPRKTMIAIPADLVRDWRRQKEKELKP